MWVTWVKWVRVSWVTWAKLWYGTFGSRESTKFWHGSKKTQGKVLVKHDCITFYYDYNIWRFTCDSSLSVFKNQKITSVWKILLNYLLKITSYQTVYSIITGNKWVLKFSRKKVLKFSRITECKICLGSSLLF